AAVETVRTVSLLVDLGRPHAPVTDACRGGGLSRGLQLSWRKGGRHGRDGERAVSELPGGDRGDEGGVGPARERHEDALHLRDRGAQTFGLLGEEDGGHARHPPTRTPGHDPRNEERTRQDRRARIFWREGGSTWSFDAPALGVLSGSRNRPSRRRRAWRGPSPSPASRRSRPPWSGTGPRSTRRSGAPSA